MKKVKDKSIEALKSEIRKIAKEFKDIKEIWLFGSIVEEGFSKAKDIDIAIKGENKRFFELSGKLIWNLEGKFKKRVDVIPLDWLKEKEIFLKYVKKGERIK